ncbi:hypothetical protein BGZ70_005474, partial [Mortierella alpina]
MSTKENNPETLPTAQRRKSLKLLAKEESIAILAQVVLRDKALPTVAKIKAQSTRASSSPTTRGLVRRVERADVPVVVAVTVAMMMTRISCKI